MNKFWISWEQPTEDYRPIYDPTKESEPFGHDYWCSGQGADDSWTMCALVPAETWRDAEAAVLQYWPEAKGWRFCELANDFAYNARFPKQPSSPIEISR